MNLKTVLVVDDNHEFRRSLEQVLVADGFTVTEAADGEEAMELFRKSRFDLVLLDIVMPKKEGFETLEEMLAEQPGQRVIVMTGGNRWVSNFYLESALERGAAAVLAKPFRMNALFEAMKKVASAPEEET